MRCKRTAALVLVSIIVATSQANAQSGADQLTESEARGVTKQALAGVAALIDADGVKVRSCHVNGRRARCHALLRGPRQTLHAQVAIRERSDHYFVRLLHIR
jgi:hypothetical protein